MKAVLFVLLVLSGVVARSQTPDLHLVKSADYRLAGYCFTLGGAGLFYIADKEYNKASPENEPIRSSYQILKYFSLGCVATGLTFELLSIIHLKKAGLSLRANPTGFNLTYRFNSSRSSFRPRF